MERDRYLSLFSIASTSTISLAPSRRAKTPRKKIKTFYTPPSVHYKQQIILPHGNLLVTLSAWGGLSLTCHWIDRSIHVWFGIQIFYPTRSRAWILILTCSGYSNIIFLPWGSKWPRKRIEARMLRKFSENEEGKFIELFFVLYFNGKLVWKKKENVM